MVTYGEEERSHRAQDEHRQLGFREASLVTGSPLVTAVTMAIGHLGEDVNCGHVEKCPRREEHGQSRGGDGVRTPGARPGQINMT